MSAVRPLDPTPANVAAVRATLAAAFVDDPMLQWIFPHAVQQAQATAAARDAGHAPQHCVWGHALFVIQHQRAERIVNHGFVVNWH